MVLWRIRENMEEIDVGRRYCKGGHPTIFFISLYHGGEFTKFPRRKYIKGKQTYVDLLDMDTFSVHDIDEMMEQLGYVDEAWKNPITYVHKVPKSIKNSDKGNYLTSNMFSSAFLRLKIHLLNLKLGTNLSTQMKLNLGMVTRMEKIHGLNLKVGTNLRTKNEDEFGSGDKFGDDSGYESSDSDDIDFYVDNDNILDDVEVDMNDFNDNIDMDAEWVGSKNDNVVQEENEVGELNEVLNNEVLLSGSSSDEGPVTQRKKTIKSIQRAHENDEENIAEPFYILQTFNTAQEFKERNVKAYTYKFLAKQIATRVESNPTIPMCALQEHLQRDDQVGIFKMKVFKARTEALNQGIDGNNGTYPSTYVVMESESTNSWTWFLTCLGDDLGLGTNSNFTFMTDRQKGVLLAIAKLFPCVEHRYYLRYIHENMKANWRGKKFKDLLWDCRAHTDTMLNNMCESLNSKIIEGRDVPIITCLEYIRGYLMKKIVTVQKEIDKATCPLTPTATVWVGKLKKEATQLRFVFCGNRKYQVTKNLLEKFVVDMGQQTCSCRRWELIRIPCAHAISTMWELLKNKEIDKIPEHWVHRTYRLETN
uniref:SWIM-type domain-containing protein n=1 Tax=Lactuca sativa TaxID=4236 RepID=A0A9R1VLN6_LACSA|nr:hypothetical protein LSAT_V11C500294990 [Lactuca sativa]